MVASARRRSGSDPWWHLTAMAAAAWLTIPGTGQ